MYVSKDLALILKEKGFNYHKFDLIIAPTEQEVVDLIFSEVSTRNYAKQGNVKWLQFWYTTLLEHKFGLMHEFIGRLEEWFESNNYKLAEDISWNANVEKYSYQYYILNKEKLIKEIHIFSPSNITKQQAKHEAILECFELLKTDKHEE